MSSFMTFGSRRISLAERSHSSFVVVVVLLSVWVMIFLLLPATLTRAISGRFRLMRVGLPTETRKCRSSDEGHSLLG
jgi:hypothetical protein